MTSNGSPLKLTSDPHLPQRDLLLDVREVARRLSARLGLRGSLAIDSCERIRVKYRVGDSLRALHRIRVGERAYIVAARAFTEGRSGRSYERAVCDAVACGPLRPVVHDAEIETIFWTFPNDRKVRGLQTLSSIPTELAQLLPAWTRSRLVAYAPEKCATVQSLDERARVLAYAKIYAGCEGRRVFNIYDALQKSLSENPSGLDLPRAIAYAEAHRMLLLEPVAGGRIADLDGADSLKGYHQLGIALAALHNLPLPEELPPFKRLDVDKLEQAARIVGETRPDVKREASDLAGELARRWEPAGGEVVCLHGDVHPKNFILRGDRLALIDLDQAGVGHPAADAGSLLASVEYQRLAGHISRTAAREFGDAFLFGYASAGRLPSASSLRWHTAAALLAERALRAVNRIRPEGLSRLREILVEAQRILRRGGGE